MSRILVAFITLCAFFATVKTPVYALTNGPVTTTVGSNTYNVYYTAIDYFSIAENYPGVITATALGSTTSPNNLVGISSVSSTFLQPWWNSSSSASAAAQTWYNHNSFPVNDGVRYPNVGGTQTPYFVYGLNDGGTRAFYATVDSSGNVTTGNEKNVDDLGFSYALATPVSE